MSFSESAPQITTGTGLKTKAPRETIFFCWAVLSVDLVMIVGFVVTVTSMPYRQYIYIAVIRKWRKIAMALIRLHLLLLLFAVPLSHVRPNPIGGEYFAASFTES